jgi:tetratricopeptide (TPR) repeat protein
MILPVPERQSHCTASTCWLKLAILLSLAAAVPRGTARQDQPGDPALRQELTRLVESGQTQRAIELVQSALRQAPNDLGVRHEYVTLHLALARNWLSQRRVDACLAAVDAILAVQPDHGPALAIQREVLAARARAGDQVPEIDKLLRLELFESALERIRETKALRPDLAERLASREQAAWLGAADDHYIARNFNEAFALYEHLLSVSARPPRDVPARWSISLALALSEDDVSQPVGPDVATRLLSRVTEVAPQTEELPIRSIIGGLLAERNGQYLDAGQNYAGALGLPWQLPPADQRRASVAALREQAVQHVCVVYDEGRSRPRAGAWRFVLPGVWKHRQTAHFDVYARNDLVVERMAEAAEFHFTGLSTWLGLANARSWEPRCELRIHATMDDLHRETGTNGSTQALPQTRTQGDRVLLRRINLLQNDPWLLSSTLPHELTHLLLAELCPAAGLPLALDTGMALQAEPPARRLQFRRLLGPTIPKPADLLVLTDMPSDPLTFYAQCDALASWLLDHAGAIRPVGSDSAPIAAVLDAFQHGYTPHWWKTLGWESRPEMQKRWAAWHEARRAPARMPLMILARPSSQPNPDGS